MKQNQKALNNQNEGVVLRSTGSYYKILTSNGKIIDGVIRGKLRLNNIKTTNPVAVGDRVLFTQEDEIGAITSIQPRHNYILRKATKSSSQQQILCSNIDQAIIIATIERPSTPPGFIDRFLVMCGAYHIPATIIFNKIDLIEDNPESLEKLAELIGIYASAGYLVFKLSATKNEHQEIAIQILKDKTSFIAGLSGAGKSSFINLADPKLNLKTGSISEHSLKGKHTTTFAEMFPLSFGGYIIDAPGLREFQITELEKTEISHYFPEMLENIGNCKFNNCTHTNEPGCAVYEAFEQGKISARRYRSYLSMLEDIDQIKSY